MKSNRLILMLIFLMISSSNPIAIKYGLNHGWSPIILGISRMSFIGLFFILWVAWRREPFLGPNNKASIFSVAAALCKSIGVICFYIALWILPASRVVMLATFSPIVNLVLIHLALEHESVRKGHVLGVAISFIGIVTLLMLSGEESNGDVIQIRSSLLGAAVMIISIVFNNTMVIFEKKALDCGAHPRQLIISTNIISVAVFVFILSIHAEPISNIPLNTQMVGAYIYLISIVGVFLFYYRRWLVSMLDISYINSFSHLGKAIAIIYSILLLGESISLASLASFALILAGTVIATRQAG